MTSRQLPHIRGLYSSHSEIHKPRKYGTEFCHLNSQAQFNELTGPYDLKYFYHKDHFVVLHCKLFNIFFFSIIEYLVIVLQEFYLTLWPKREIPENISCCIQCKVSGFKTYPAFSFWKPFSFYFFLSLSGTLKETWNCVLH